MKTDIKNFPRGLDEKDLLYLIWLKLGEMGGGSGSGDGDGSFEQVQADWEQSDDTQVDYIKNKPTIPVAPLVVKGGMSLNDDDMYAFTPDANQPTFDEAIAAFNSGVPVILDINPNPDDPLPDGVYYRSIIFESDFSYDGYQFLLAISGGTSIYWIGQQPDQPIG